MSDLEQMLALRDGAKSQLMQIKSVEDGISYLNKLSAIDVWVKAEKKDAELQNIVAEQKIRTQRVLGQLLREGQEKGEIATQSIGVPDENTSTLSEIGLTRKQSSTFQQIASIPDETFEEFIQEKKAKVNDAVAELTTTGAVRLAKSLKQREEEFEQTQELDKEFELEMEIRDLARELKSKYKKPQLLQLIKLLQ
jgi:tetraacyldisaccharide-1-P 4'-kinase